MKKRNFSFYFVLAAVTFFSSLIVWSFFALNTRMTTLFANYDGPNYLIIAKCWYQPECIRTNFSLPLPLEYYPAHFPGYPLLIALFDLFLPGWWAMLLTTLLGAILMTIVFYQLLKSLKLPSPEWLTIVFLFLPGRMLILRSVGAPEPLFIAGLLFSILMYRQKKYLLSGISLAFSQAIKTPAILLFLAFLIDIFLKRKKENILSQIKTKAPLFLGPLIILPIFLFFQKQTGDFWAYFHSGDNFHLVFPPFQTFISSRSWLGDFWLEDIIYLYLIGGLAVLYLIKKYGTDIIALFPLVFYLATLFVAHRDLSRYSAPLYPFWIIAFSPLINQKEFKIVFLFLLPAIYLYALNFITYNLAPIADWTPYF